MTIQQQTIDLQDQTLRNQQNDDLQQQHDAQTFSGGNGSGRKMRVTEANAVGTVEEFFVDGAGQTVSVSEYLQAVVDSGITRGDSGVMEIRRDGEGVKPHFSVHSMASAMVSDKVVERANILGIERAVGNLAAISGRMFQNLNAIGTSDIGQTVNGSGCCRKQITMSSNGDYEHGSLQLPVDEGWTKWKFVPSSYCNIKPTSTLQHEALAEEASYIRKAGGEAQFGRMSHGDQDIWNMRRVMVRGHAIGSNDYFSCALEVLGYMRGAHFNNLVEHGHIPAVNEETQASIVRIRTQHARRLALVAAKQKEFEKNATGKKRKEDRIDVHQEEEIGEVPLVFDLAKAQDEVEEEDSTRPRSEGRIAVIGEQQLLRHYTALEKNPVLQTIAPNRAWERLDDDNRYVVMVTQNQLDNAMFVGGLILLLCGGDEVGGYGNWGTFDHAARFRWGADGNKQIIFVVEGSCSKEHRVGGQVELRNDNWYDYYEVFNAILRDGRLPVVSDFKAWRLADYLQAISIWAGNIVQFKRQLSEGEVVAFGKQFPGQEVRRVLYKWWEASPRVSYLESQKLHSAIGLWKSPFWVRWAERVGYVTTRYLSLRAYATIEGPRLLDYARVQAISQGAMVDALAQACNVPMGYVGDDADNHAVKEGILQRINLALAKHLVTSTQEGLSCVYLYGGGLNNGVVPSGWVPWVSDDGLSAARWRYCKGEERLFTLNMRLNWSRWVPNLWYKGEEIRLDPERYYLVENAVEDDSGRLFVSENGLAKSKLRQRIPNDALFGAIWSEKNGGERDFMVRNVGSGESFGVCTPPNLVNDDKVRLPVLLPSKSHGELVNYQWNLTAYKKVSVAERITREVLIERGPEVDSISKVWSSDGDLSFV